jgi:hypothetical protein
LKNQAYDEAVEISQSVDQMASFAASKPVNATKATSNSSEKESKSLKKGNDQSKSQSVLNERFDEALEFSQSGSEDSVDTKKSKNKLDKNAKKNQEAFSVAHHQSTAKPSVSTTVQGSNSANNKQQNQLISNQVI